MIVAGLGVTLSVASVSLLVACVFGLIGAVAKLSASPFLRGAANAYTTVVRSLPDLLLMLGVFYGGQILLNRLADARGWGYIEINPFAAGTLTLGFVFGAYLTETFRGAILAIPRGQIEAGYACGLTRWQVLTNITLPQMIRHAIPGFTNNWLVMLKATALVSIIGLDDMVHRAGLASAATRAPFTFYALTGAIYLAVTTVSILVLWMVERRFSRGVRREALR
jgi:His/Glu/Gln/Arg/opine family amino acid ABC transporter permease subunit